MPSDSSCLLSLPAELRLEIYSYYFTPTMLPLIPPPLERSPLALSLACRQLYYETHALAIPATMFPLRAWRLVDIKRLLATVRPPYNSIKRLELQIGIYALLRHPESLRGLRLAAAGLPNLEEICLSFEGQRDPVYTHEHYLISNLEIVLWKTISSCENLELKKIRVVHRGLFFWHGSSQIYKRMRTKVVQDHVYGSSWTVEDLREEGYFSIVLRSEGGKLERRVMVLIEAASHPSLKKDK